LPCYKKHKESCQKVEVVAVRKEEDTSSNGEGVQVAARSTSSVRLVDYDLDDGGKLSSFAATEPEIKNIEYDFVSSEKLKKLGKSLNSADIHVLFLYLSKFVIYYKR
jgi:hypothetical protein